MHAAPLLFAPLPIVVAVLAVAVGPAFMHGHMFGPQQLQGDAGSAQFAVDVGAVGLQVTRRAGHRWLVQPGLKLFVAQGLGRFC